jgi:hypothetical protein
MNQHSSVRPKIKHEPGICGICGGLAFMRWHDVEIGVSFGDCCRREVILADLALTAPILGLTRPASPMPR